ncbi:MAG: carboxypeptidase regulatory-like domain-containing protein [Gemmatimonadales bacterium]
MRRPLHAFALSTLAIALLGCAPTDSARDGVSGELHGINGTVIDAPTSQPIPHAIITIGGDSATPYQTGARTASADSAGDFRFDSIPFSPVWVLVRFIGYHDHEEHIYVRPGGEGVLRIPLDTAPLTIFNDTF